MVLKNRFLNCWCEIKIGFKGGFVRRVWKRSRGDDIPVVAVFIKAKRFGSGDVGCHCFGELE